MKKTKPEKKCHQGKLTARKIKEERLLKDEIRNTLKKSTAEKSCFDFPDEDNSVNTSRDIKIQSDVKGLTEPEITKDECKTNTDEVFSSATTENTNELTDSQKHTASMIEKYNNEETLSSFLNQKTDSKKVANVKDNIKAEKEKKSSKKKKIGDGEMTTNSSASKDNLKPLKDKESHKENENLNVPTDTDKLKDTLKPPKEKKFQKKKKIDNEEKKENEKQVKKEKKKCLNKEETQKKEIGKPREVEQENEESKDKMFDCQENHVQQNETTCNSIIQENTENEDTVTNVLIGNETRKVEEENEKHPKKQETVLEEISKDEDKNSNGGEQSLETNDVDDFMEDTKKTVVREKLGKELKHLNIKPNKEKKTKEKSVVKKSKETKVPKATSDIKSTVKKVSKKDNIPKLVKPILPSVSVDEVMKNKENKPVPKLGKASFKAPVKCDKKIAPSFKAPKKKTIGGKRPVHHVEELEIELEPPAKKTNIDEGK